MAVILHITQGELWTKAQTVGRYKPLGFETEGFIHCSQPDQLIRVANMRFRGQTGLVLLFIDPGRVASEIRYENLEGGEELFPHIYGPLSLDSVVQCLPFEPDRNGLFSLDVENMG